MSNEKNAIQEWAGVLQCVSVQHTNERFSFWCHVGEQVKHENLVSNEMTRVKLS